MGVEKGKITHGCWIIVMLIIGLVVIIVVGVVYEVYHALEKAWQGEEEPEQEEPAENGIVWHGYMQDVKEFWKCAVNVDGIGFDGLSARAFEMLPVAAAAPGIRVLAAQKARCFHAERGEIHRRYHVQSCQEFAFFAEFMA